MAIHTKLKMVLNYLVVAFFMLPPVPVCLIWIAHPS